MRERDQPHSYWYIPSAPRVNYSLLVMETAGMIKMASDDGFPLRQGVGMGSRLVFHGYRGLRRRNSRSRFLSGGFSIYRSTWRWNQVRGVLEGPTSQGARPRGGGAPLWLVASSAFLSCDSSLQYFLYFPKIFSVNFQPIPRTFISAQKQHHGSSAENSVSPG